MKLKNEHIIDIEAKGARKYKSFKNLFVSLK